MSDEEGKLQELHELVKRIEELEGAKGGGSESTLGQITELETRIGHEVGKLAKAVEKLQRQIAEIERTLIAVSHATSHIEGAD